MCFGGWSENFLRKYLLPIPTGGQNPVWPKTLEIFFLHLPPDTRNAVGPQFLKIYFLYYPPADEQTDFSKKFIFLYEFSAALVYMGEMSTPTIHWRCGRYLNRVSEKFFSSAYKQIIHPNRTPFRSKMSRSFFCLPTYPLRMKMPFGRKYRKFIFRPHTYPCGWTSRFGG